MDSKPAAMDFERTNSRDGIAPATPVTGTSVSGSSIFKARHISLQSRVDSIAAESMPDVGDSVPDLPTGSRTHRSTSNILDPNVPRSYEQTRVAEPAPPNMEKGAYAPAESPSQVEMSTIREVFFIAVVALAHFLTQAALGQTLAPIDTIAETFNTANPGEMSWFVAAYSLTVGTFILISGRLGDIIGHKRVFAFGYAWFGLWSSFAGFSGYPQRQIFFDVCRAMQGVGPALLLPNGLALLGRAYQPGIKKNIVFSIFGAVAPAGFVTGALFSSLFAQVAWWPWAFWSFSIVCFTLSALTLIIVPEALCELPEIRPSFDWTGSVLGVTGMVLVNVAWNNGPLYGWGTQHVYFVLIIGLLFLVGFGWYEFRAVNPILPIRALNSTVGYILALIGLGWGAFGIWVFYSFRFLEKLRGHTPLIVSAQYTPAILCGLLAGIATGFMLTHTPVSCVMMISMFGFMLGTILAATQPVHQSYWAQMFLSIIIMPFGMDMSFPAATVILSNHMPREHQGLAASLVNTVLNYSISITLGIAGTVEVYTMKKEPENLEKGIRSAYYTGVALSVTGVVLGIMFFVKTMVKEGWRIMEQ